MIGRYFRTLTKRLSSTISIWFRGVSFEVYTDGSFKNGWGSWAYVIVRQKRVVRENSGRASKTNSLRMELRAAIEALGSLREAQNLGSGASFSRSRDSVSLFSDSRTLVDAMQAGKEVSESRPNADLLNALLQLSREFRVEWRWVRAHSGQIYNERCDELCVLARTV
jgi:ribonuclease HI